MNNSDQRNAFIFDMDGTIIDSMPFHVKTWLLALEEVGVRMSVDELAQHNHGTIGEVIRSIMGEDTNQSVVNAIAERKESLYRQVYRPSLRLLDGAQEFLDRSKAMGMPMALATNANWDNINFVLDGLNLWDYFDVVLGNEDIQKGKPDPQIFLLAAKRLGVTPEECVVFEDSQSGILAGARAGMRTIAISTTIKTEELAKQTSVEYVIHDYRNLHPEDILNGQIHITS